MQPTYAPRHDRDLVFQQGGVETFSTWIRPQTQRPGRTASYLRDMGWRCCSSSRPQRTRGSFEAGYGSTRRTCLIHRSRPPRSRTAIRPSRSRDRRTLLRRHRHPSKWTRSGHSNTSRRCQILALARVEMQCGSIIFQCLAVYNDHHGEKGRDLRRSGSSSRGVCRFISETDLVPQSLILQMPRFGMDVVLPPPPEFITLADIVGGGTGAGENITPVS